MDKGLAKLPRRWQHAATSGKVPFIVRRPGVESFTNLSSELAESVTIWIKAFMSS
jgi:hypothetical protein